MRALVARFVLGAFVVQSTVPPVPADPRPPRQMPATDGVIGTSTATHEAPVAVEPATGRLNNRAGTPRMSPSPEIAQALDLHEWSAEGTPGAEAWDINEAGTSAESEAPPTAAFLVSPTPHGHFTLQGILSVPDPSEANAAGIVLGYHAPMQGNGSLQHNYLLLAWRPAADPNAEIRGQWILSRVRPGVQQPEVLSHTGGSPDAYALENAQAIAIEYSNRRVRVVVADEEVLDVEGNFPSGRVGFYAAGGARALFSDFELQAPSGQATAPEPTRDPDAPDPSVAVSLTKTLLWPADHTWEGPGLKVYVTDPSGSVPSVEVAQRAS